VIEVRSLNKRNITVIQTAYEAFRRQALTEYCWSDEPVDFETLQEAFENGYLKGLVAEDPAEDQPLGLMLYVYEQHRAVEVNLIYIPEPTQWKSILDYLMRAFLAEIKNRPGWDCVSYAMLGIQERLVSTIPWYGFVPIGQTIQKFDFVNEICLPILAKQNETLPPLPDGYTMVQWEQSGFKPRYKTDVQESIAQAFAKANDARWDPRFRTVEGAGQALYAMQDGGMGVFIPECTSVLIHQESDRAVGFCFLVQTDVTKANIPLIGLRPDHKGKGLGNQLLKNTLMACVKRIIDGQMLLTELTATVDTDNFFALKMYRKLGFQETHNYPHCYLNVDTVSNSYYGREIFTEMPAGCCSKSKTPASVSLGVH